jgi:hypothetical protein
MAEWLALSDIEQLSEVARYLGPAARQRSLAHGRVKNHRWSLDELAQLRAAQPAYPEGEPASNWSDSELSAFIAVKDAEIAAQPRPKHQLRIDQLNDEQLKQLAAATTQAEADRLLNEFTTDRND